MSRKRRRLRWTVGLLVVAAAGSAAVGWALYRSSRPEAYVPGETTGDITATLAESVPADAPLPEFVDVTRGSGLESFRSFEGERSSQLPEDMGPGVAWGDYDGDGDPDPFLVAAGGPLSAEAARRAPSVLFENRGDGTFRREHGFPELRILGMGAAWGDYDGDGRLDLVVTGYRSLALYRNGEGGFVRDDRLPERDGFWAGASWGDYDGDRDLDLYVCGYVRYRPEDASRASATLQYGRAVPYTLNPASYSPERNLLFRNDGRAGFTEVGEDLGVHNPDGRSLGALWHDFDDDGLVDLYVANDISDNVFYRNLGGTFEEISHAAWIADYRGAMGLAAGDWNRDGDDDLFVSHWIAQENALYDSLLRDRDERATAGGGDDRSPAGSLRFVDVSDQRGLGQIALRFVGWGAEFADLDGDGWLDLLVANGSTFESAKDPRRLEPERDFLLWNRRGEYFHDLAPASEAFSTPRVSRGLALADYDDDGDLDVLVMDRDGGARLLRNDMQSGAWVKLRLRSRGAGNGEPPGFGEGAKLTARVGEAVLRRSVGSSSYLSQSDRVVHFGLGEAGRIDRLEVEWPAGATGVYEDLAAGTTWELREGEPRARRVGRAGEAGGDERERTRAFWAKQRAAMEAMKSDGDCRTAVPLFRESLELRPDHEDSRYYLANCLSVLGDAQGALDHLERLRGINPHSHRAHKQLGILRAGSARGVEELEEAEADLERSLAINPEETGSLLALGEVALMRGDLETAERRLEWVCRTNPKAVGAFFLRAYVAWKRADEPEARRLLERAGAGRGEDWKPEGATAEGDVRRKMHLAETPLSRFWTRWDGSREPRSALGPLDAHLHARRGE